LTVCEQEVYCSSPGCQIYPLVLDLGTNWRWAVTFTLWPLYSRRKISRHHLGSLGGPQSQSGRCGEEKILDPTRTRSLDDVERRKFLTLPGLEVRPRGRPARNLSLYRLGYPCSQDLTTNSLCKFSETSFRFRTGFQLAYSISLYEYVSYCTRNKRQSFVISAARYFVKEESHFRQYVNRNKLILIFV
jgi:hypothetical protein